MCEAARIHWLLTDPLHLRPCFGFYCLQLVLFSNLFWSDVWQDYVSWKQIDMDYLSNIIGDELLPNFGAKVQRLYYYMRNFCNLIGLEQ